MSACGMLHVQQQRCQQGRAQSPAEARHNSQRKQGGNRLTAKSLRATQTGLASALQQPDAGQYD